MSNVEVKLRIFPSAPRKRVVKAKLALGNQCAEQFKVMVSDFEVRREAVAELVSRVRHDHKKPSSGSPATGLTSST